MHNKVINYEFKFSTKNFILLLRVKCRPLTHK